MARLIIDTSLGQSNLALAAKGQVFSAQVDRSSQQAEWLVSEIDELMQAAGLEYAELSELVSVTGPGSFTGIRVGLAAARALLLAYPEIQSYTLTSLQAMAQTALAVHPNKRVAGSQLLVLKRAGKGEVYAQHFEVAEEGDAATIRPAGEPLLVKSEALDITKYQWLAGNGVSQLADDGYDVSRDLDVTRINAVALLSVLPEQMQPGAPEPLYIRPPDAVKSIKA